MKKVLLLAGLMAVSSMALGAVGTATAGQAYVEGDVTVQAKVVENLTMTVDSPVVDFGTLLKNQQNKTEVVAGKVTIAGEPNTNIKISVGKPDGTYETVDKLTKGLALDLKDKGGTTGVNSTLKFNNNAGTIIDKEVNALDEKGKFVVNINGTANALQTVGDFSEIIKVKAQYE